MEDKNNIILKYVQTYPELFDDFERNFIVQYIRSGREDIFLPDLVRELYDKFGIISDDKNIVAHNL